jgi:hypothetical protein
MTSLPSTPSGDSVGAIERRNFAPILLPNWKERSDMPTKLLFD